MKALTIWQPWASLIMAGAKPYEFRRWAHRLPPQRIVIHAGARPVQKAEIRDLLYRLETGETALKVAIARPIVERAGRGLPLASGLGTAVIGRPVKAADLFAGHPDSDRIDHHLWAWPLSEIQPFEPIVPMRGMQGFWLWPDRGAAELIEGPGHG